jgi:hypothetical protein
MKKLYIFGLSILSMASINAQNIFSSDLSSWTGGEPDGFMGSKSHTVDLTVTEITTGANHGTSTARLEVANGSSHRRFSTQPLSVTNGQGYEVIVYAKGEGELRVGMFDDHTPTSSAGFINYTTYTTINTATTQIFNFNIVATNTASNAEFIISVINTVAPNHIEIDSIAINETTITPPPTGNYSIPFYSDLSDWTGSAPDGFMGSKTNITGTDIVEITSGVSHGTSLAQLINTTSSHKRFTTQPVEVVDGQGYEVVVFAKGQGDLRIGMFDDHSPSSSAGFIGYTGYSTINSAATQDYTFTVVATNSTTIAEFVLSFRNTVAPNHIEIDSVAIYEVTVAPPATVSVYDIQFTTDPSGDSPYKDQIVNTGGIVYHVRADGRFYMSSGTGPWTGIYVFEQNFTVVPGDSVTFTGEVVEFFNLTELKSLTNFNVVSQGNFFMANNVTTAEANTEAYEGCLVSTCGTVTAAPNNFNEYPINDGSGDVLTDDFLLGSAYIPPVVGNKYLIKGIVDFSFGDFKILPRNAADVQATTACIVSVTENYISYNVYPNPTNNELNIEAEGNHNVSILDINGKVMLNQITNGFTTIDVSGLASGMYLINVEGNMTKFIKN